MISPAHSMDTAFYAITKSRNLVMFYTGEEGIIPAGFPDDSIFHQIPELEKYLDKELDPATYTYYNTTVDITLRNFLLGHIDLMGNRYTYTFESSPTSKPIKIPRSVSKHFPVIDLDDAFTFDTPEAVWYTGYDPLIIREFIENVKPQALRKLFKKYAIERKFDKNTKVQNIYNSNLCCINLKDNIDLTQVNYTLSLAYKFELPDPIKIRGIGNIFIIKEKYEEMKKIVPWLSVQHDLRIISLGTLTEAFNSEKDYLLYEGLKQL